MSYVLDALKKAQAEREQGALPNIHTVQVPQGALPVSRSSALGGWRLAGGVLVLAAGGLGAWWWLKPAVAPVAPAAVKVLPAPVPVAAAPSAVVATPLPPAPAVAEPPPKPQAKAAAPKPVEAAPALRVYAIAELPERVRAELPRITISGGSYSSDPAQRLIIVNNQVLTEKSQAAPGVVVERIEPDAAVLVFRGFAYRIRF